MNASSSRVGILFPVTLEMIETARDMGIEENNIYGIDDAKIASIYRAMRALEPGHADEGVTYEGPMRWKNR